MATLDLDAFAGLREPRSSGPGSSIRIDGRSRRSCGSVDRHTAQSHPIEGTPCEVPLPSTVTRIGGSYRRMIIRILKRRLHSDSVSFLVAFVSALKAQDRIGPAERLARRLRDPAVFADLARAAFRAGDTRRARRLTELAKKRGAHADELRVLDGPEEQTDDEPDQALQSGDRSTTRRLVAEALTENHWQESVAILGQLAPDVLITMATELLAIGLPEGG